MNLKKGSGIHRSPEDIVEIVRKNELEEVLEFMGQLQKLPHFKKPLICFVQGEGGTGKTPFLQRVREYAEKSFGRNQVIFVRERSWDTQAKTPIDLFLC